jgi:hypothetical protein
MSPFVGDEEVDADERREHIARHQQRELQVPRVPNGRDEVGVVAVVDGCLPLDQFPLFEFVDDAAPLPGVDVEFLPELALVDTTGLPDQL